MWNQQVPGPLCNLLHPFPGHWQHTMRSGVQGEPVKSKSPVYHSEIQGGMFLLVISRSKRHKGPWTLQTVWYSKGLFLHGWDRWSVFLPIVQSFKGYLAHINRNKEDTTFSNEARMGFSQHIINMWKPSNGIEIPHIVFLCVCFYKFHISLGWECLGLTVLFFSS
jgi:hypothetical protein